MNKKDLTKEITRELAMREKVWPKIGTKEVRFQKMEHNDQYAKMKAVLNIFEAMTDREYQEIINRIERNNKAAQAQKSMF